MTRLGWDVTVVTVCDAGQMSQPPMQPQVRFSSVVETVQPPVQTDPLSQPMGLLANLPTTPARQTPQVPRPTPRSRGRCRLSVLHTNSAGNSKRSRAADVWSFYVEDMGKNCRLFCR